MTPFSSDRGTLRSHPTRLDQAVYLHEMLGELKRIAENGRFRFIAYLIGMAELQSEIERDQLREALAPAKVNLKV